MQLSKTYQVPERAPGFGAIGFLRPAEAASRRSPELETELNHLLRETLRNTTIVVLANVP